MKNIIILLFFILFMAACREQEARPDASALLTNPGPETLNELQQTVSTALNGVDVTLSDDVFITSSVLVVERGMQRGIDRPPELGRDLGRPHRFQLMTNGPHCILVDLQNGLRYPLINVVCIKED